MISTISAAPCAPSWCARSRVSTARYCPPDRPAISLGRRCARQHHPARTTVCERSFLMLANDPVTQARIDLTTALRAAARHGLNEGVCNHFSMTVPGREDLFLVNPQGLHWSEITPSDLVMADGAGNIVEGKYPVEASAFFIHARIHAGNPRA